MIFLEGDVENPVQAILNLPVPADRCCQDLRVIGAAGQKVADVGFGLRACLSDLGSCFMAWHRIDQGFDARQDGDEGQASSGDIKATGAVAQ